MKKRDNSLSWHQYFCSVALVCAKRSKDPNTQVGCCIVNEYNRIVATGYNGLPRGISDDDISWAREGDNPLDTKYPYIIHAELNAILAIGDLSKAANCTLYTTLFPCIRCAMLIIQAKIKNVYYISKKNFDPAEVKRTTELFKKVGIKCFQISNIDVKLQIND